MTPAQSFQLEAVETSAQTFSRGADATRVTLKLWLAIQGASRDAVAAVEVGWWWVQSAGGGFSRP
jgi:hypothetical protein